MSAATSGGGWDTMMSLRANDIATDEAQEVRLLAESLTA